jgi:hypothetical protein
VLACLKGGLKGEFRRADNGRARGCCADLTGCRVWDAWRIYVRV